MLQSAIDEALHASSFLQNLCAMDCGDEVPVSVCLMNPDGDGPINGYLPIGSFTCRDGDEFKRVLRGLAAGHPHRIHGDGGLVQAYDFFRFLLTAHKASCTLSDPL